MPSIKRDTPLPIGGVLSALIQNVRAKMNVMLSKHSKGPVMRLCLRHKLATQICSSLTLQQQIHWVASTMETHFMNIIINMLMKSLMFDSEINRIIVLTMVISAKRGQFYF